MRWRPEWFWERKVGFLRQLFKKDGKPENPDLPEPAVLEEQAAEDLRTDEILVPLDDEDTIVPPPPVRPADDAESEAAVGDDQEPVARKPIYSLAVGHATHVGRVRRRNEDSALVITTASLGDAALPPYGLFIVADGMGGHSEGQQASQMAARIVAREVMEKIFPPFLSIGGAEPSQPVQAILESSLQAANWEVQSSNPESGTTLTAALVLGERLYVAHVGDSRAYLIRDGHSPLELLTLDHSFVQRLQDTGQITAEEAAIHPQRNILYRAVGQGDRLEVDTFSRPFPRASWLVLCSDGLWGVVGEAAMRAAVTLAATPQQACDELIEAALSGGGPDNISVIVVHSG
jgi:serine/threonine protein phosphatase PrpC